MTSHPVVAEVYAGTGVAGTADGDRLTTAQAYDPEGLAWSTDLTKLYWVDSTAGRVRVADAATDLVSTLVSAGLTRPEACEYDPTGSLWVGDQGAGRIIQIDVSTGVVTPRLTGYDRANAPRLDGTSWVYFIHDTLTIRRFPYPSGAVELVVGGFSQAEEMRFHPDSGLLYVADFGAGTLVEVDVAAGTKTTVVTGIPQAQGVAIDSLGDVYVSNRVDGQITRYVPSLGTATPYFSDLATPNSIDFGPGGILYVADFGADQIVRLNVPRRRRPVMGGLGFR